MAGTDQGAQPRLQAAGTANLLPCTTGRRAFDLIYGGRIIDNRQIDNLQIDNWQIDNLQIDNNNLQIDNLQIDNQQITFFLRIFWDEQYNGGFTVQYSIMFSRASYSGI